MTAKLKALQDLRDQITAGKFNTRDHKRHFFEGVDGKKVFVLSDEALEELDKRIAQMKEPA